MEYRSILASFRRFKFLCYGTPFELFNHMEVKQKFYMVLLFNYIMETEQEIKYVWQGCRMRMYIGGLYRNMKVITDRNYNLKKI